MSAPEKAPGSAPAAAAEGGEASLLDQVIAATKQTERSRAEDLVRTLATEALNGTVKWDRNLSQTLSKAVAAMDAMLSKQLAAIMHNKDFQKVESSWRGLQHLVMNSETSTRLKVKVLNVTKRELFKD